MGNSSYGLGNSSNPGGERSFNACLVLVNRYIKALVHLTCNEYHTAMDTDIMILNKVISHRGLFQNITSDRDPNFTSALWTDPSIFGTKISFSADYHPHTDGLEERMIQTLEDIIRRLCAYG
ncbi:hypothetical protein O181_044658 [Austropuccinia psidii MF-1]|uniref:Integrase catalytic domain-containing protein n=1 Tax=Austropuccinia psidii MF-1 TaxID=1389203 RepID=A0A9Q3DQH4_9BASI|nr:hypothetical protein [Austropuccinia psidii MF-1]